ncbi:MAG: hypothetical protein ACRDZU_10290, partial [Acidimicrobiales bacterium]
MSLRRRLSLTTGVWLVGFAALRLSLLAPEACPRVSNATLLDSAAAAADWIEAGQERDGRYLYEYDRDSDEAASGYN